jgi:hypothetical protein
VPTAQAVQAVAAAPEYNPAAQAKHSADPVSGWYFPDEQLAHSIAFLSENIPAEHAEQDSCPEFD